MFGKITGTLVDLSDPISVEAASICFEISVSKFTRARLPEIGKPVALFLQPIIKEDDWQLFGFFSKEERGVYRHLVKVSGVGPKVALAILSGYDVPTLAGHIERKNILALSSISGIGKKTAERIALELHGKLFAYSSDTDTVQGGSARDAMQALVGLGIRASEAAKRIKSIEGYESMSLEELIREGLRRT